MSQGPTWGCLYINGHVKISKLTFEKHCTLRPCTPGVSSWGLKLGRTAWLQENIGYLSPGLDKSKYATIETIYIWKILEPLYLSMYDKVLLTEWLTPSVKVLTHESQEESVGLATQRSEVRIDQMSTSFELKFTLQCPTAGVYKALLLHKLHV